MRNSSDVIQYYSPYSFSRKTSFEARTGIVKKTLICCDKFTFKSDQQIGTVYYKVLDWDSNFFGLKTIRIHFIESTNIGPTTLVEMIDAFDLYSFDKHNCQYMFFEIPSEDILLLQALGESSFKLIETRLHYYYENLQTYEYSKRFGVRQATSDDIENLRQVAARMRNKFDRFHADTTFDQELADNFLAKYVEESIKDYSDLVITPEMEGIASDSFLAVNFCEKDWPDLGMKVSRMILSAVSSTTNKGWFLKLVSEMNYILKDNGVEVVFYTTQSTNRAVYHVLTKLGFQLGAVGHVFSKSASATYI